MFETTDNYKNIVFEKIVPERKAEYVDFPEGLSTDICKYLIEQENIRNLYSHQAEMFNRACNGQNVIITTSTASGKTLSFLLPVLQEILNDPLSRAIFLYPTKALASDQFRNILPFLQYFGKHCIQAGVYDGDTPVNERSQIRNSANIILTNPEMLNSAFLPNHNNYGFNFVFSNLKYIVIDELHSYRGAFGSHLANVFRRLNRICNYYNSSPRFLCSSATIANPVELAENISGKQFSIVENDGSPSPKKTYYFWQPPTVRNTEYRISPAREAVKLIPDLILKNKNLIAFCKSRNTVEIVLKESRDFLKDGASGLDFSSLISGYRGGYKPQERRDIEQRMSSGKLKGLIATNVLELGIDIGRLDTSILIGFPGTKASFWQQAGRAGRKGKEASVYLILDNLPLDQYLTIDPAWLFNSGTENAVIDKNNLFIQLAHIRAAAAEIPLSLDDVALFPGLGEIVPVLLAAKEVKKETGKFVWSGKSFPAGDFSLRNTDKTQFKLKNIADNSVLTQMDELQAYREIYEGAIYMHEGVQFYIENLDTGNGFALAKQIDVNYYTISCDTTEVSKINSQKSGHFYRSPVFFGDVRVAYTTFGFKRLQFHNHQNLGYEKLNMPLCKTFETEGFWIRLPDEVSGLFLSLMPKKEAGFDFQLWNTYFDGVSFAIINSTKKITMTTQDDISFSLLEDDNSIAICVFDMYIGGLGFSNKAYNNVNSIIEDAIKMVEGCKCKDGCTACVGDYHLDKKVVLWGLKSIFEKHEPPHQIKIPPESPRIKLEKLFDLDSLESKWTELVEIIISTNQYLSKFLSIVDFIKTGNKTLSLYITNSFYRDWISDELNMTNFKNLLKQYVNVPSGFEIKIESSTDEESNIIDPKVIRRFIDLTK